MNINPFQIAIATMMIIFGAFVYTNSHAGDVKHGEQIYQSVCIGCHGTNAEGGIGPKLSGQSEEELYAKMMLYKAGVMRGPMSDMMFGVVGGLSKHDIEYVSKYLTTIK